MTKSVFKRLTATIALALSCVIALALPGLASAQTLAYGTLVLNVPDDAEISQLDTSGIADEANVSEFMDAAQQMGMEVDEAQLSLALDVISQADITAVEASSEVDYFIYLPASVVSEKLGLDVSELAGIDEESWSSLADEMTTDLDEVTAVLPGAGIEAYSSVIDGNPVAGITFGNIAINGVDYQLEVAVAFIPGDTDPGMLICLGVKTVDGSDLTAAELLVTHENDDIIEFGGGTLVAPAGSMSMHVDIWGLEFLMISGDDGAAFAFDINSPALVSEMGITAEDVIAALDESFTGAPEGLTYQGAVQDGIAVFQIDMTGSVLQMIAGMLADGVAENSADIQIPGMTAEQLQAALADLSQTELPDLTLQGLLGIDDEQLQVFLGIGLTGGQTVAAVMA